ncbi:type I-E CRISPR-associated protein Cas7/Cse4/CasC [Geobacter sp. AOG1]|uniref:type I-E CRISPR-associated protein Cas7/Cse4/CasC n=1 Tax=Geobacter sp. AOG1 TaxID=1566346 RepID=UPI001CC7AD98|nr:type I-E CRISPR-associated protein Cas7/Cse4/CasC [Geobacter sp. AOG1]GFE57225.1 Cse4 family CRISPR-associated protein [Geobacter sp. AOG1]
MSTFIQLHLLTSYPPSNLNRDDLGRPKTAIMGGKTRLRVSSQSLKRAWRTSEIFTKAMKGHVGTRTKAMGVDVYEALKVKGVAEGNAKNWAKQIAEVFGKAKKANAAKPLEELEIEQLAHFSPEEKTSIFALVDKLAASNTAPTADDLKLLQKDHTAADIAMFGRMLASSPAFNTEAAVQVAHAVTVHDVAVEDDYFTAVDDLNNDEDDLGAAHIGETEFGAGLFYLYVCIDRDLLQDNLGDKTLANKALTALLESSAKVSPTGKQNSFASRARTSYLLAEKGSDQPRSLSVAFLKPVRGEDILAQSIKELERRRENFDKVYGPCADGFKTMNAETGMGSLGDILTFVTE